MENIKVMVRIRPLLSFEDEPIWVVKQNSLFTVNAIGHSQRSSSSERKGKENKKEIEYQFNFECVAEEIATSEQIYKREIKATLINSYNSGRNVSIMAYGQTCSGKTHTILGIKEAPGIIPCVLRDLFALKNEKERKCSFKISYIEIYNEKLYDLLEAKEKCNIKIVESPTKTGYQVLGAAKQTINRFQDALKLLEKGEKKRQYGQGEHHERSSRSHTLLNIYIDEWDDNYAVKSFVFTIVDLAGSERLTNSQQSTTQAGYINKSLFQLTNCVSKLSDKAVHIPFRDSKLTMLLEASLTGSGRSFIICCISPSKSCFGETLSTLRLAERAKRIELKEPVEEMNDPEMDKLRVKLKEKTRQCSELKKEIERLNSKIQNLQYEMGQSNKKQSDSVKANLLILLDHQNFTLFLEGHIDQSYSTSKAYDKLKQKFVENMQQLYENFTKQIIKNAYGDNFQLQIEQLCFMNMVLEHEKIMQYKIDIISELLKQNRDSQEDSIFYHSLEQYQKKLKTSCNFTDHMRSFRSSNREFLYENNSFMIGSRESEDSDSKFLSQAKSVKSRVKEQIGSEVLVWGCKKDFRVCKGQANKLNMVRISNIGKIRSVVCGYHHTLVIVEDGRVYGWGKNTERQVNQSNRDSISSPVEIKEIKGIKSVAAGWGHSLALTQQGTIYSWGYGKDGQLGQGDNLSSSPKQVPHKAEISSIYAGHSHSAFIDIYGDMYAFGFNLDYRLMIDESKEINEPRKISVREVLTASLGVTHTVVITASGCVYAGGTGRNGQLGVHLDENIPGWQKMQVVDRKFQEENYEKICPMVQMDVFNRSNKAKEVRCGENMTIVLNDKGEVYSFGKILSHRVGHSNNFPTIILQGIDSIECGSRYGFALNSKQNKLYSWGFNMYGQANPQYSGDIETPQLIQGLSSQKIISISSGFFHSAMLVQ